MQDPAAQAALAAERQRVGRFFYRMPSGESGADVYDRATSFLQTLYRQTDNFTRRKFDTYVIVAHGLFIRLLLMRYFRWSVEQFHRVTNLENCEMCVLERNERGKYVLTTPLRLDAGGGSGAVYSDTAYGSDDEDV